MRTNIVLISSTVAFAILAHSAELSPEQTTVHGGSKGHSFADPLPPAGARVVEVRVGSWSWIDAVQMVYALPDGSTVEGPLRGGNGGRMKSFRLADDEYIIGISGTYFNYLDSICFHTNKRTSPVYGGTGGSRDYRIDLPAGRLAAGFAGRCDRYVDAIGLVSVPCRDNKAFIGTPGAMLSTPQPTPGLTLPKGWNQARETGALTQKELGQLLLRQGAAGVDLRAHPDLIIYKDIRYLDPLENVCRKFGKNRLPAPVLLTTPGFPENTFDVYMFDGTFDDGFNQLLIVADRRMQVVAIEFVDESPAKRTADGNVTSLRLYDLIRNKVRETIGWSVQNQLTGRNGALCLDSELVDENGLSRKRVRLLLPQPIINLVLFRLSGRPYETAPDSASANPPAGVTKSP